MSKSPFKYRGFDFGILLSDKTKKTLEKKLKKLSKEAFDRITKQFSTSQAKMTPKGKTLTQLNKAIKTEEKIRTNKAFPTVVNQGSKVAKSSLKDKIKKGVGITTGIVGGSYIAKEVAEKAGVDLKAKDSGFVNKRGFRDRDAEKFAEDVKKITEKKDPTKTTKLKDTEKPKNAKKVANVKNAKTVKNAKKLKKVKPDLKPLRPSTGEGSLASDVKKAMEKGKKDPEAVEFRKNYKSTKTTKSKPKAVKKDKPSSKTKPKKDLKPLEQGIREYDTPFGKLVVDSTDEGMRKEFGKGGMYKAPKKIYGVRNGGFTRRFRG